MKAFLIVMVIGGAVGALCKGVLLAGEHPRTAKYSVGFDCLSFITEGAFLAWACYLLASLP